MSLPPLADLDESIFQFKMHIKSLMQEYAKDAYRIGQISMKERAIQSLKEDIPRGGHGEARELSSYEYAERIRALLIKEL